MQFKAFKPQALNKIAGAMGYQGDMSQFQQFIEEDPQRKAQMDRYTNAARMMAKGGVVKMQTGGNISPGGGSGGIQATSTGGTGGTQTTTVPQTIGERTVERMYKPAVPVGGEVTAQGIPLAAGQEIAAGTGTVTGSVAVPTAIAGTSFASPTQQTQAAQFQSAQSAPGIDAAMNATQAAQATPQDPRSQVTAAQQTATSVGNLQAAQGNAILINNPQQRQIQAGELISGSGVDATKAAQATAQTQAAAAQANPSQQASVQGQLAILEQQFQGANPPAWAAGAIRTANAQLAARGLGASSIAGQAVVQAAIEASLPIAQADAAIAAQFEQQNLSNRQQSAMLAAEQRAKFLGQEFDQEFQVRVQNAARVADVANMNFTAEQQIALENSRIANTMNLQNLSNSQAMVLAEASALANMDLSNLNNRQQAAVQNAQSFMQVDMANLSNQQQTELFKAQQRAQSMFTDQAAENAARQFNAANQQQVDQFFANLANQVSQFNATQANAQSQFNAGQVNTLERFNAELNNQRDQFNAKNQLVIAQNNAQWRREIATADTAAVNRANELNANAILDISNQAYSNLWQYYGDTMEWAWTSAENAQDRIVDMAIAELDASTRAAIASEQAGSATGQAVGNLVGTVLGAGIQHGFGNLFCWVAREVYGKGDPRWFIFRTWMQYDAPKWFRKFYGRYGKQYAQFISNKPALKWLTRKAMDIVIENKRSREYASV